MGKIRFAPNTRRFADLPHKPCVYIAELSTGVVKVGASNSARARLMSLASELKRLHGAALGRYEIFPRATPKAAYELETCCVRVLAERATSLPGRREFFTGISFDHAINVVREQVER